MLMRNTVPLGFHAGRSWAEVAADRARGGRGGERSEGGRPPWPGAALVWSEHPRRSRGGDDGGSRT